MLPWPRRLSLAYASALGARPDMESTFCVGLRRGAVDCALLANVGVGASAPVPSRQASANESVLAEIQSLVVRTVRLAAQRFRW